MAIVLRAGAAWLELAQEDLGSVERGFARLGAAVPHQLPIDPYGRTVFSSPPAVRALAEAIAALRSSYRAGRTAELVRERQIRAPTPALVEQAVAPLLAKDRDLATLDRLLAFLEEVLAGGASPLIVEGD
jgi:hypothetical protein